MLTIIEFILWIFDQVSHPDIEWKTSNYFSSRKLLFDNTFMNIMNRILTEKIVDFRTKRRNAVYVGIQLV